MKTLYLLLLLLGLTIQQGFSQKLMLSAGYTRVGANSFSDAASTGLHLIAPLGPHIVGGVTVGVARNRQPYQETIFSADGVPRTITAYNNFLYSLQVFLAGRLALKPQLDLTLGPSAGLYVVGARERSDELKPGFGLWSNLTYKRIGGSRFNLEAVVHPRILLHSASVDDVNFRFEKQHLFVWDTQLGVSFNLLK